MAGHSNPNSHRCTTFLLLLFCMLLVSLLWGCGGGTSEPESSEKVPTASTDTGSAVFAIQWHTATADQASAVARQAIGNCETAGVASITCQVYDDESQNPIASGGPWNCADHHGTIEQIPAGANRVFAVLGWSDADGEGYATHQGQIGNITITAGQTTNAGAIDARPFVPAVPTPGEVYGNQINLSWNDLGVYGYRIYRDGVAVDDTTATTYSDTGLNPVTTYCYTISGLDSFGNESGQSGQTCTETANQGSNMFYRDADNDNYGNPDDSTQAASPPEGYVADNSDCDDSNGAIYPGAPELLDGRDNDCDGSIDEGFSTYYRDADGDTYGNPEDSIQAASPPSGYVTNNTDCNDGNDAVHPGATETCNGIDDNCAGGIDENLTRTTTCGVGACAGNTGTETCSAGNWGNDTCDPYAGAGDEVCDNVDNDCDGSVDDGLTRTTTCGVGACEGNTGTETCSAGNWGNDTCDPYAGASDEVCFDGIDNNCDEAIDDFCAEINPTSSFTARLIGNNNVLVGDANDQEGQQFNSTFLSIKEGTSDRVCLEFDITSRPVPRRVTLDFSMNNLDDPSFSNISLYSYRGNGLANAADYFQDDSDTSEYISTFSDNGASGTNPYSIDVTDAYLESIKMERTYMGILMQANDEVARYSVYNPVLTLSY